MAVCFTGGAKIAVIAADMFAVAWAPTGSHAEWRRIYDVAPGAIITRELRVKGLAEGETLLPGSQDEGEWHVWHMPRRSFPVISFGSEPGATDWKLCGPDGTCNRLADMTGAPEGADVTAVPCKAEAVPAK
jgi:Domain of unknown function (DUF1850)